MGTTDKLIRIVLAIVFFAMAMFHVVKGPLALACIILGVAIAFTAFLRFCPLYPLLKIHTMGHKKNEAQV